MRKNRAAIAMLRNETGCVDAAAEVVGIPVLRAAYAVVALIHEMIRLNKSVARWPEIVAKVAVPIKPLNRPT